MLTAEQGLQWDSQGGKLLTVAEEESNLVGGPQASQQAPIILQSAPLSSKALVPH